jgi:hypothetical protein
MKSAAITRCQVSSRDAIHRQESFHDSNVVDPEGLPVDEGVRGDVDRAVDIRETFLQTGIPGMFDVADVGGGVHPEGRRVSSNKVPPGQPDEYKIALRRLCAKMTDKKLKLRNSLFNKEMKHPDATVESAAKHNIAGDVPIEAQTGESGSGGCTLQNHQVSHRERANSKGKYHSRLVLGKIGVWFVLQESRNTVRTR